MLSVAAHLVEERLSVSSIGPPGGKAAKTPQLKHQPTMTEAVRAAEARITWRNSLREQRDAKKGKTLR
jgi:hypothetical protein